MVLGGGYVNTELRQLSDPRVFEACDYITLDDGERPLLALLDHLRDPTRPLLSHLRPPGRAGGARHDRRRSPICATATPAPPPTTACPWRSYVSLLEMLNPMHRLWSDGRWNKLTVARGCYWKKCTFCDVSLDYISRYEAASAEVTVDRIEALVRETGQTGFHFVDEAAPPAALRALAQRLMDRQLAITWWGNIRFEKSFTPALVELLARSGCVAVSGGLEVASDRLLDLMKKGVTVAQVARVARAFSDAGVLVHAYLMYGFPSETEQETVDALERVRQLFAEGCIQSGFWHRFAATAHSPIGQRPDLFGIRLRPGGRPRLSPATRSPSTTPPAATTSGWAPACARRSTITCTASGWTGTCGAGSTGIGAGPSPPPASPPTSSDAPWPELVESRDSRASHCGWRACNRVAGLSTGPRAARGPVISPSSTPGAPPGDLAPSLQSQRIVRSVGPGTKKTPRRKVHSQ